MDGIGWKLAGAAIMLYMVYRMWPAAKHWSQNGPKGSANDWMVAAIALGAVIGFVLLLITTI